MSSTIGQDSADLQELLGAMISRQTPCKVCGANAGLMDVVDFNKTCNAVVQYRRGLVGVPVYYYECSSCGFVFTEFFDDWDTDRFARFVYNDEYLAVDKQYNSGRPESTAQQLARLFGDNHDMSILDYGGGNGLTADLLRKAGYREVRVYDPFSQPERPSGKFDVVMSIAAVEHSPRPVWTFEDMCSFLRPDGLLLVGTAMMDEEKRRQRGNWWYIAPRNGHVSIFTSKTMAAMAERLGLEYYTKNKLHVLARPTRGPVSEAVLRRIQYRYRRVRLQAPGGPRNGPMDGWGRLETVEGSTRRWTVAGTATLALPPLPPGSYDLHLELPIVRQAKPGFATECRFRIDDVEARAVESEWPGLGTLLTARLQVINPAGEVELITPEPVARAEVPEGRQARPRGLAVAAGDAAMPDEGVPG